jgi:hypothetical protein
MDKKCSKCKIVFSVDNFPEDKSKKSGYRNFCKKCYKQYLKEYREKNKQYFTSYRKKVYEENKEEIKKKSLDYYYNNREKRIQQIILNKEKNKTYYREYHKNYVKERSKKDIKFKLKRKIGNLVYQKLKNNKNNFSWQDILDFTVDELIYHLEALMKKGMTWENYGKKWHIDHRVPDSWFIYESFDDDNFKISWSLWNLQPMWAEQNISKGNRFVS